MSNIPPTPQEQISGATGVGISIGATLHRGHKWSSAHGVPTCTDGFGLCNFTLTASASSKSISLTNIWLDGGQQKVAIIFNEAVPQIDSTFITDEEGLIPLPTYVDDSLGFSDINILPGNYHAITNDADYPFGYVICNVIAN